MYYTQYNLTIWPSIVSIIDVKSNLVEKTTAAIDQLILVCKSKQYENI